MARKDVMVPFIRGMSQGLSTFSDDVQLVNYFNVGTPGERSPAQLVDVAGSTKLHAIDASNGNGCRGLWASSTGAPSTGYMATLYGVWGDSLFRVSSNGTKTRIGTVNNRINVVTFAENQDQTKNMTRGYVCDGTTVYTWDIKAEDSDVAATYAEIAALPEIAGDERAIAKYITYNTYRLILTTDNSVQWYFTGPNDDEFIGFESSESNPDKTVRAISFGGNIWVFSSYSYDIFSYTGAVNDPYDVASGATGKIGCANGDTVAVFGDNMFWLGQGESSNDSVYMATVGGAITEVSTPGIRTIIRGWQYKQYARGFAFNDRGLTFYALTSVNDKHTILYCLETKQWHRRSTAMNGALNYWDVVNVVNCYGKIYFGTAKSNRLCVFDYSTITDHNGYPITRFWQSPIYIEGLDFFSLIELKIDTECGTNRSVTDNQQIYIQLSWDGGKTWGESILRSLGTVGDYARQVVINGCGAGRNLVMRIGTSATIPVSLYQIKMSINTAGRS